METTYYIVGTYQGNKEILDETYTIYPQCKDDAEHLRQEYRLAYGNDWIIEVTTNPSKELLEAWNN